MTLLDSMIVMIYLLFIGIAAWLFRRFSTSSNDFLQGGGTMMWWMAGATAFMTQFSAWTFTGAAAKAYEDGISVMFIFWGNALGFFVAAAFFARRYRRLRVETAMEVIRVRFGHTSEQLFTWLSFPLTLIAVSGGAWTVSVTNVIQLVLLIAITLVIGYTALQRFDSPSEVFAYTTPIYGEQIRMPSLFVMWAIAMLLQQTMSNNHTLSCYRFLTTANDKDAIKAAFVAGVLFVFAPVLWFMPAWFVAAQSIDLLAIYPALEQSANNAAYLYYIQHYMPQGLLGLVMVALVAATIAPLSSAHNRNAGIVVKSLYQVWFNPNATNRQQLMVGKIATIVSGVLATVTALLLASVESYSLFDMMIVFAAFIQMPINIPSLLALVSLKTPNWSGWATVMVGCAVSLFMMFIFNVQWLSSSPLTPRERKDLSVVATLAVHLLVTGGFFLFTRVFYAKEPPSIQQSRTALAIQLATPISDEELSPINHKQGLYVGSITALAGMLLILAGVVLAGSSQSIFVAIGCIVLLFSLFLLQPTQHSKRAWQKQKTK